MFLSILDQLRSSLRSGLVPLLVTGSVAAPAAAQVAGASPAAPPAASNTAATLQLPAVAVEGQGETALSPGDGFVARRSTAGTKTDTPIAETPQSISVLAQDQLDQRQVQSIDDALRYSSGVETESFGADPHVDFFRLRGFSANDLGLYQDGLRLSPGVTQLAPEPYGLQRIDILKGPSSVLYGQDAPGGLVDLISKRPTDTAFGDAEILGGSYGRIQGQADMGGPIEGTDGKWSYRLTGLAREAGQQVDELKDDRIFVAPAVTWKPDANTTVTLLSSFQKDHAANGAQFLPADGTLFGNPNGKIGTSEFLGEQQYNKVDRDQTNIGYEVEHHFDDVWTVRQNARFTRLDYSQRQVYGLGLEPDQSTLDREDYGSDVRASIFDVDSQAQAQFRTGPVHQTVLAGVDYSHTTIDAVNSSATGTPLDVFAPVYGVAQPALSIYSNTYQTADQVGLYAQDQLKLDRWILTLGVREDLVSQDTRDRLASTSTSQSESAFTYRAGLGYGLPFGLTPYVSYARSFQPLYGTNYAGQSFKPTNGEQVEVGAKYQPPGFNSFVTGSLFDLTQTNVETTDASNPLNTLQTGEVRVRGAEVEATASLMQGLDLVAAYTYLDAVITKGDPATVGNQPNNVPRHTASLWANYTFTEPGPLPRLAGLGFGAGVRYLGTTEAGDADYFKVRDTTLLDAAVHYDLGRWRLAVNANNLFDRTYVAHCDSAAFCYYGYRRTVLGSLGVHW